MAEIPIQPKRGGAEPSRDAELPVQPTRRRSVWPWVAALVALLLLAMVLLRRDRRDETATAMDTSAFVDTTSRLGGRTSATAAGAVAADTSGGARTPGLSRSDRAAPGDTAARPDTTARADSAARRDTTTRP